MFEFGSKHVKRGTLDREMKLYMYIMEHYTAVKRST